MIGRLLLEVSVPAGMVAVIVGVDDEAYRLVGDALQRGLDLFRQRGVLVVDDDDAVLADRGADVAGIGRLPACRRFRPLS